MARWEHENISKKSGTLFIKKPDLEWEEYPSFSEGRQDYWSGFAIDFLMGKELPHFIDHGGHETGVDHALDFSSNFPEDKIASKDSAKKPPKKSILNKLIRFFVK